MYEYITLESDSYEAERDSFEWNVPDGYNAAEDFLHKHDDPADRVALYQAYPDGRRETYTFADLDRLSNKLANALRDLGVQAGDRVGLMLPQKMANPLVHLACWKLGAISMPLSVLFGPTALEFRLTDSSAKVVFGDTAVLDSLVDVHEDCPALETLVEVDGDASHEAVEHSLSDLLADQPDTFDVAVNDADADAIIIYTSGTTGDPKGVLHRHAFFLGHCTSFYMFYERDVFDSVFWTPAGWEWMGGLGDLLFPAWHYGRPVVGYPMGKFDVETAYEILEEFQITDSFLPPTALRMMMDVDRPTEQYDLALKAICSGGESLTTEILDWAAESLGGVKVNELYGQTEAGIVCTCHDWFQVLPGSMGKPAPGHDITILDPETATEKPPDEVGEIAVRREDDPGMFKQYWEDPERTADATVDGWHLTGDLGHYDEDGYFWYKARADEVIITSGYRVGPREVEDAILEHPDVAQVAVIGVPDDTRGEIIKAFVQPAADAVPSDRLRDAIQAIVQDRLAKYEHPRAIEFVDELPQTATGKIRHKVLRERELEGE